MRRVENRLAAAATRGGLAMRRSHRLGTPSRAARRIGLLLALLCLGGAAAAPQALAGPPEWTDPAAIDPSFNAQDLSCASSSLCLTIGQSGTTAGTTRPGVQPLQRDHLDLAGGDLDARLIRAHRAVLRARHDVLRGQR